MPEKLKRTLSLAECVFFGIGSILGAGIYTIIGKVAGLAGNLTWLSFVISFMAALFTAFSYAELSAAYPKTGGEYVYTRHAFGDRAGRMLGMVIALNGIISGATVAVGFGGYLTQLIGMEVFLAALGIIALIFLVNVSGIRESSVVNIIFTLIEVSGLVIVVIAATPSLGSVNLTKLPPQGGTGILLAASLGFFAFIGFEEIVKLAEEAKTPQKTIPRALFAASFIVAAVYILVAVCAVSALPAKELAASKGPLADIVREGMGAKTAVLIVFIALFSTSNTILSNMLGSSRVIYAIAKDVKALGWLSKISPKRQTPYVALILIALVMAGFAAIGRIEVIAMIANLFIFITFFTVNLCVIRLRRSQPSLKRPFIVPLTLGKLPLPSLLGMALTLLLFGFNIYFLLNNS